jgi:hypothetical protein
LTGDRAGAAAIQGLSQFKLPQRRSMNVLCRALHPKRFFLWNPKTVSFFAKKRNGF